MPTLNQISNLPFENNLLLNGLNKPDRSKLVYDLSGGWNVLDYIVTRNGPARQVIGLDGQFQKPIMGVSVVQAVIASTVLNGLTLRVSFTDPNYDNFRTNFVVSDGTSAMNKGLVVAHAPGYVDLQVTAELSAWNTAIHFLAGGYITELWQSSVNRGSGAVESQYEYPEYVTNQTAILRDNCDFYRRDVNNTWVEFQGDMWAFAQQDIMMENVARQLEYRGLFSGFGSTTNADGKRNYSMGLKASIKDSKRGGIYNASPSLMTQASFEAWIAQIANRRNAAMVSLTFLVGRGFLSRIQSFVSPFIQYSGRDNTFGGEAVDGLDVYTYTVNGISCKFIMAPILNDSFRFPTLSTISGAGQYTLMSYTAICLDTDMYDAKGGGKLPAMEKVYFGPKEMEMYYVPGVASSNLKGNETRLFSGDLALAANHNDAISVGIYTDCGYDFMSYRSGWFELTN